MARAVCAAAVEVMPAPSITTSVGDMPATPPSSNPLPPCSLVISSEMTEMAQMPSISDSELTTGKAFCWSLIRS